MFLDSKGSILVLRIIEHIGEMAHLSVISRRMLRTLLAKDLLGHGEALGIDLEVDTLILYGG